MRKAFFMPWRHNVSECHGPRQLFIRHHQASLALIVHPANIPVKLIIQMELKLQPEKEPAIINM